MSIQSRAALATLRIVVAPDLWRTLASGCAGLALLTAIIGSINAAAIPYHLYATQRVELSLLGARSDAVVWSGAMILLTLTLMAWRQFGHGTVVLAVLGSFPPILLTMMPSPLDNAVIFAGTALLALLIWRVASFDRGFLSQVWASFAGLLILIEAASLSHWLLFPYSQHLAQPAGQFELNLAYSGYLLVKPLMILLLLSWIALFLPLVRWVFPTLRGQSSIVGKLRDPSRRAKAGLVLLSLGVAVLVGAFPYLGSTTRLVGGDIDCCYMPTLLNVLNNGLGTLQGSDRLFFYAVLYAIHSVTGASAFRILMLLPVALTAATAFATFVMIWIGLRHFWAAISGALVSALTFNTTAAIFMDLFANWFANALLLLTLALFLYAYRGGSWERPAAVCALSGSVLILFSHALVWWSMIAIVTIFGITCLLFSTRRRVTGITLLAAFLVINFVAYETRLLFGTSGSVLDAEVIAANYLSLAWRMIDGSIYAPFWSNLTYFLRITSVFYANWLILALAILGVVLLGLIQRETPRDFRWMLGGWMLVGAVLTVTLSNLLNPYYSTTSYMPLVWRGLFMIPIQIPVGFALASLLGSKAGRVAYLLLLLMLLNFAFRTMALTISL